MESLDIDEDGNIIPEDKLDISQPISRRPDESDFEQDSEEEFESEKKDNLSKKWVFAYKNKKKISNTF